jgi:type I restriction enzyme S subunit
VSQSASIISEDSQVAFDGSPLPDGWRHVKLRDVILEAQGGFASGERDANGVIQLRMNNVTTSGQFEWSSFLRVPASPETIQIYRLENGDVLFNNTNSTELVGKSALFEGYSEPVVFSNHFTRLRADLNFLEPSYLATWLQHQWQRHTFAEICNRWIGQSAVQRDKLLALEITLPQLSEQKRIAAILKEQMAAVERARAAAEAQLKAAKDLPAAYLRAVFDSQEAQQWTKEKLVNVSLISGGIQKTPDRKPKIFHRPYLTVRNVQRGYLDLSALERFEITESELDRLRLMQGDILIVEGNGSLDHIGRNALFRGEVPECIHQNHIIRVRLDEQRFIPEFVSRFLNSDAGKAQMIQKAMTTSGLYTLSAGKVAALEIPMPSLTRQREIVETLNEKIPTAENTCKVITSQLETISSLPAALLRQAFTGKL